MIICGNYSNSNIFISFEILMDISAGLQDTATRLSKHYEKHVHTVLPPASLQFPHNLQVLVELLVDGKLSVSSQISLMVPWSNLGVALKVERFSQEMHSKCGGPERQLGTMMIDGFHDQSFVTLDLRRGFFEQFNVLLLSPCKCDTLNIELTVSLYVYSLYRYLLHVHVW